MADDFVPSTPMATVNFVGPGQKKEYYNCFLKNPQDFTEDEKETLRRLLKKVWLSAKDSRNEYVNVNGFVSREERERQNKPKDSGW